MYRVGDESQTKRDLIFLNYHPASQSLGTPPKQGGELARLVSPPDHS